jgi:hypothetical protein
MGSAYSGLFAVRLGLRAKERLESFGEDFDELRVQRLDHDADHRLGARRAYQKSHVVAVHRVDGEQFVEEVLDLVVTEVFHRDTEKFLRYASPGGPGQFRQGAATNDEITE